MELNDLSKNKMLKTLKKIKSEKVAGLHKLKNGKGH